MLHPPGVPRLTAPVLGGGGQRLVDDYVVEHSLHTSRADLLLLKRQGVILRLDNEKSGVFV